MSALIDALDNALAETGQDIVLRRIVGDDTNTVPIDVAVRAKVNYGAGARGSSAVVEAAAVRSDATVIISPTQIARAQWPGGEIPSESGPPPSLPRAGDICVIDKRDHMVQIVIPFRVGGELVRIEMKVLG